MWPNHIPTQQFSPGQRRTSGKPGPPLQKGSSRGSLKGSGLRGAAVPGFILRAASPASNHQGRFGSAFVPVYGGQAPESRSVDGEDGGGAGGGHRAPRAPFCGGAELPPAENESDAYRSCGVLFSRVEEWLRAKRTSRGSCLFLHHAAPSLRDGSAPAGRHSSLLPFSLGLVMVSGGFAVLSVPSLLRALCAPP